MSFSYMIKKLIRNLVSNYQSRAYMCLFVALNMLFMTILYNNTSSKWVLQHKHALQGQFKKPNDLKCEHVFILIKNAKDKSEVEGCG